jgi:hypothetical protein
VGLRQVVADMLGSAYQKAQKAQQEVWATAQRTHKAQRQKEH